MKNKNSIVPDIFIHWPYSECKNCWSKRLWILSIYWNVCNKKCTECFENQSKILPKIKKKVIYIDQFAISNMMMSINLIHPSNKKEDLKIWRKIYEKLNKLVHFNLIVCPYSETHEIESVFKKSDYKDLKTMFKFLSRTTKFKPKRSIENIQIYNDFENYINENWENRNNIKTKDALKWWINQWSSNMNIDINNMFYRNNSSELKAYKESIHSAIDEKFQLWKKQKYSFEELYLSECQSLLRNRCNEIDTKMSLENILKSKWISNPIQQNKIIEEYYKNINFSNIPFINIHSALWSQIAYNAWRDIMSKAPNRGTLYDIDFLSIYKPYCDIMLIDKSMKALLSLKECREKIDSNTKFFGGDKNDIELFYEYLKWLEESMSEEYIQLVEEIYWKYESAYNIFQ